jgi:hypothetical protein
MAASSLDLSDVVSTWSAAGVVDVEVVATKTDLGRSIEHVDMTKKELVI